MARRDSMFYLHPSFESPNVAIRCFLFAKEKQNPLISPAVKQSAYDHDIGGSRNHDDRRDRVRENEVCRERERDLLDVSSRLFVAYDKAKEYLNQISQGVDQQVDLWQYRRQVILDQMKSASSSSASVDFLLPKTQRINDLTIEAVQGEQLAPLLLILLQSTASLSALCRVELLIKQILRIDPKSASQSRPVSSRSFDHTISPSTSNTVLSQGRSRFSPSPSIQREQQRLYTEPIANGKIVSQPTLPVPVVRKQQPAPAVQPFAASAQKTAGFKPIEQHQSSINTDSLSRPTVMHPRPNAYSATEELNSVRYLPSK